MNNSEFMHPGQIAMSKSRDGSPKGELSRTDIAPQALSPEHDALMQHHEQLKNQSHAARDASSPLGRRNTKNILKELIDEDHIEKRV